MVVKKILRSPEEVAAYYHFIRQSEVYTLRWIGGIGAVYSAIFLIIDIWRASNYQELAALRTLSVLLYGYLAWRTFTRIKNLHWVCYIVSTGLFIVTFLMDYFGGMPPFFLTNYICLLFFVFNAALGHPSKFKLWQTSLAIVFFMVYAWGFSPHRANHLAQVWNLLLNATLSMLIGYLIERYKVLNFVSRLRLVESRRTIAGLSNLKTKLISVLSHDFASPLNQLKGLLSLKSSGVISSEELDGHTKK